MRLFALASSVVLSAWLASGAYAQCQRGGSRPTTTSATMSSGTSLPTVSLVSSAELARQQMQQAYLRQMRLASRQAAYSQLMRQADEQQQTIARQQRDKRQKRLDYWRQRRETQVAQREAARRRNLARSASQPSLLARQ